MASGATTAPGPPEDVGVAFPVADTHRSTTATGRAVVADAARAVDADLAEAIAGEEDWYGTYADHLAALVAAEISGDDAAAVPTAGLASLYDRFELIRDGEAAPLTEGVERGGGGGFHAVTVEGTAEPTRELAVPVGDRMLRGEELRRHLRGWVQRGVVEPSFAAAIGRVIDAPEWLDLRDRTVVVLGAAAEMGPLEPLCSWGASVVAVDLPRPELWRQILATVRRGAGSALIPLRESLGRDPSEETIARHAGTDLILEAPETAAWLSDLEGPLTLGNYVYADGGTNVRVSVAVDAVVRHLTERRDDVSLAVLATPTDVFAAPREAVEEARRRFDEVGGGLRGAVRGVTRRRLYAPNFPEQRIVTTPSGGRFGVADSIIPQQGPNYALAKRLHRWRARHARRSGVVSSINVAPPTRTRSVLKNRMLAAAYRAAPRFGIETPEPETSRTLMAALMVHDLHHGDSAAHPSVALDHPLEMLIEGAAHGGFWRIPFAPRSVLPLAVVRGMLPGRA